MLLPDQTLTEIEAIYAHLDSLSELFARMDTGYSEAARGYGFQCTGCDQNCCETLFHHHTLAEYLFLQSGFLDLAEVAQTDIQARAAKAQQATQQAEDPSTFRVMCPLNDKGMCRLYAHRPMICRLHGIPHELNHPVRGTTKGPGCAEFDRQCDQNVSPPLVRTPFYQEMAQVESRLRADLNFRIKIKMTVTRMVLSWAPLVQIPQEKTR